MARLLDVGQEARGVIAIGQHAMGVIAIGQIATGVVAIGQVARGVVAIGMVAFGLIAVGMVSVGVSWSSGLAAVGGKLGPALLGARLVPRVDTDSLHMRRWWVSAGIGAAALVAISIAFWLLVGVPLQEILFGNRGVLR